MRAGGYLALLCLCLLPGTMQAQDDDRGYLTAFLEDNLSGAGRQVTITGFEGALSSTATIARLTIADDQGVWITLTDLSLDWSRSALLRGELSVNALTADTITIIRPPQTADDSALPAPEAAAFSLPELPVSVDIDQIAAARILLAPAVLGQAVEGRLQASASLNGGEGTAELVLERTDGTTGLLALTGAYSNTTGALALDLRADEAAGGLAATLLGLPGRPSVQARIAGTGRFDDFQADIDIGTDGETRLAGLVTLSATAEARRFSGQLSGNPAPLFLPDYAAFFGDDVALEITGRQTPAGLTEVSLLQIGTRTLDLTGSLTLAPDGLPLQINLAAALADPQGDPVLLPLPDGPETRVQTAQLDLAFDAARSADWQADLRIDGLSTPDLDAAALTLTGRGQIIADDAATGNRFDAMLSYAASGLAPRDPDLARALGAAIAGNATLGWQGNTDALTIPQLTLTGDGIALTANASVAGLTTGLETTGRLTLTTDDFARYSGLAGQPLSGAGTAAVAGAFVPLSGAFDGTIRLSGRDLGFGIAQLDALLQGTSQMTADLRRDETGLTLRDMALSTRGLTARASGTIATTGSALQADLDFTDLAVLGGPYRGALTAQASFAGTPADATLSLTGQGRAIALGQPEVDRLLAGTSDITLQGRLRDGGVDVTGLQVSAANLRATVSGRVDAARGHDLQADLDFPDLSVLGSGYRGGLTAQANFRGTPQTGQITLEGEGRSLALGQPEVDRVLAGRSTLFAQLALRDGLVQIDNARLANPQLSASATGLVEGDRRNLDVTA
ncbi:MAG: translocation and assembly module protein TamB, partial [Rhodobacteraceae bacterium]|nr:translocation and assembly module protein TamB [Paracoccaceae bacterium]